jgi:hypothetical protein
MPLQLEVLLHLAAQWGEVASILVATGAAAFLVLDRVLGAPNNAPPPQKILWLAGFPPSQEITR